MVIAGAKERIAASSDGDASLLDAIKGIADNPPGNCEMIGYFLHGMRAVESGKILADAPEPVLANLLAAVDPELLAWPTVQALRSDFFYGDKGSIIPRRLAKVFEEVEARDEAEQAYDEAMEQGVKKAAGTTH